MTSHATSMHLAHQFANGTEALFAQASTSVGSTVLGATAGEPLHQQAEQLGTVARQLTLATSLLLDNPNPLVRSEAATRLLATSLIDLQVSALLMRVTHHKDNEGLVLGDASSGADSIPYDALGMLRGEANTQPQQVLSLEHAAQPVALQRQLARTIGSTLATVVQDTAATGKAALYGLLSLGLPDIYRTLSVVLLDLTRGIAQLKPLDALLGQGRAFIHHALEALQALLGASAVGPLVTRVVTWVRELDKTQPFEVGLTRLYDVAETFRDLSRVVMHKPVDIAQYNALLGTLQMLRDQHRRELGLINQLLNVARFLGATPLVAASTGHTLLACFYALLGSYALLSGGDVADAPRLRLLNRTPGVRMIVVGQLSIDPC